MSEKTKELTAEEIEANWNKFEALALSVDREGVAELVDSLGERIALCPASANTARHEAYAGGLVEHSLNVLQNLLKLRNTFAEDIPKDSLILCALFHDLGKVGDLENDFYVPQTEQWKLKKGDVFAYNNDMQWMAVAQRSVWLLNQYGVKLSTEETLGILLHDGQYIEENKAYKHREPMLATLMHMADLLAVKQSKV